MVKKGKGKGKVLCIICGQEKKGSPVADDPVMALIRKAKRALGVEKGNRLVVCGKDLEEHFKKRKQFEKTMVQYGALAFILVVAMAVLSRSLPGIAVAILLGLFIVLLGLGRYWPALEGGARERK